MGPLPKRKMSKGRRDRRRAHDSLSLKQMAKCESCGAYHIAHHVCPNCGSYRGETVVEIEADKK